MQGSSVVTKIGIVLQTPTIIPDVIGSALTSSSNFFINYVAIQVSFPLVTAEGTQERVASFANPRAASASTNASRAMLLWRLMVMTQDRGTACEAHSLG